MAAALADTETGLGFRCSNLGLFCRVGIVFSCQKACSVGLLAQGNILNTGSPGHNPLHGFFGSMEAAHRIFLVHCQSRALSTVFSQGVIEVLFKTLLCF